MPDDPIRVFLLDDHEIVRRGLMDLIHGADDIVVVGEAGTAAEAMRRLRGQGPLAERPWSRGSVAGSSAAPDRT